MLYNQTISAKSLSILQLNSTVFEFFKNDAENVKLYSAKLGINTTCPNATCFYNATIASNPDLSVTYNGLTTVMKYVNTTSPTYYATLQKVDFTNVIEDGDSFLLKANISTPSASLIISNFSNLTSAYLIITNTSTLNYLAKIKRDNVEYLELNSTIS